MPPSPDQPSTVAGLQPVHAVRVPKTADFCPVFDAATLRGLRS